MTVSITNESRELRYHFGTLCERYNKLTADKDCLDTRLGCPQPYEETAHGTDAEQAYETESHTVTAQLRGLITEMAEVLAKIRALEGF